MGSVWRAEHIDLGTPAAVKLIDESFVQSPEALTRFRREAQAAASLRSANVVQILDYGVDGDTPFIAMELLEGDSLADRLERQGRLEPSYCAAILVQVSKALSRAHDQGIVHRDLKPDNIFLVRDGDDEIAKVLDFGIAKRTGALQTSADMATRTGSLMGTPYYMSPEQASGRRQVDQRTDIWAFAVIAYECVTGVRPFDDSNLGGLLLAICTETPKPPSQLVPLPPAFDAWFARCTVRDPAGRYETIREAASELCRAIGIAAPASRLFSASQPDGMGTGGPQQPAAYAGTGPWAQSRGMSPSVATPGALIMSASGVNPETLVTPTHRRAPIALIVSGAVGALGLIAAVAALVWRGAAGGPVAETPSAAPSAQPVVAAPVVPAAPPPVVVAPAAPSVAQPAVAPTEAPSNNPVGAAATKPAPRNPVIVPRQTSRRVPAQPSEPAQPQRLRPQDRLERDLGF